MSSTLTLSYGSDTQQNDDSKASASQNTQTDNATMQNNTDQNSPVDKQSDSEINNEVSTPSRGLHTGNLISRGNKPAPKRSSFKSSSDLDDDRDSSGPGNGDGSSSGSNTTHNRQDNYGRRNNAPVRNNSVPAGEGKTLELKSLKLKLTQFN